MYIYASMPLLAIWKTFFAHSLRFCYPRSVLAPFIFVVNPLSGSFDEDTRSATLAVNGPVWGVLHEESITEMALYFTCAIFYLLEIILKWIAVYRQTYGEEGRRCGMRSSSWCAIEVISTSTALPSSSLSSGGEGLKGDQDRVWDLDLLSLSHWYRVIFY